MRNTFLLFVSHPACSILLYQPQRAKTARPNKVRVENCEEITSHRNISRIGGQAPQSSTNYPLKSAEAVTLEGKFLAGVEALRRELCVPSVMVCARVGKAVTDMRQNERRIKFTRAGDAVRIAVQLKGEPTSLMDQ